MKTTSAVLLASLLALAACQRVPEGPAPTTSSAKPSPTASASTAPPAPDLSDPVVKALPPEARIKSEEGAKAFARFFVEQVGAGFADTQAVDLDRLYTRACTNCKSIDRALNALHKLGATRANPAKVTFSSVDFYTEATQLVQVAATFKRLSIYKNGKRVGETGKAYIGNLQFHMDLEYDGHWRVAELHGGLSAFQD